MNQVTQQNAANSQESASAAEELSSQAEEMRSLVATFQLTNNGSGIAIHPSIKKIARTQPKLALQKRKHRASVGMKKISDGNVWASSMEPKKVIPLDDMESQNDGDKNILRDF
jgi:hypothetical protein